MLRCFRCHGMDTTATLKMGWLGCPSDLMNYVCACVNSLKALLPQYPGGATP